MEPKYWWTIIGIAGFIVEIFSAGFFAASLGIGAFCAAITSLMTDSTEYQLIAMSAGSLVSFFAIKPLYKKYLLPQKEVKTNADAIIGRAGIVSESIDREKNTGRVAIDGDDWKAVSVDHEIIKKGSNIIVTDRESIILTVRRA